MCSVRSRRLCGPGSRNRRCGAAAANRYLKGSAGADDSNRMASSAATKHPLLDHPSTILVVDRDENALADYHHHLSSHAGCSPRARGRTRSSWCAASSPARADPRGVPGRPARRHVRRARDPAPDPRARSRGDVCGGRRRSDQPPDTIRALFTPERRGRLDLPRSAVFTATCPEARHAVATWSRRRARPRRTPSWRAATRRPPTRSTSSAAPNDRLRIEMVERARLENERRLAKQARGHRSPRGRHRPTRSIRRPSHPVERRDAEFTLARSGCGARAMARRRSPLRPRARRCSPSSRRSASTSTRQCGRS